MKNDVLVIRTGAANLASVAAALRRAGARAIVSDDPSRVASAPAVVLPGVGAFGPAMERLRASRVDVAVAARVRRGRPTLAICLGLQLLTLGSEEAEGVGGVGVLQTEVARFPDGVRVPQMGWNDVTPDASCALLRSGAAYFANSLRVTRPPKGWSAAWGSHGGRFVAALERGAVLACQFHPELSGAWGADLISRWLVAARGEVATC